HVAPAPVQLELALALAVRGVLSPLDDRQVGVQETIAYGAHVAELAVEVPAQVVEEQSPHAAGLAAVLEVEVFVAPLPVGVIARLAAIRLAQLARHPVPVQDVLVERIERGQVEAAAEP